MFDLLSKLLVLNFLKQKHEEKYLSLASPVKFHDSDVGPKGPAPLLGEHNKEILTEMGYSKEEINKLEENGIIGKSKS